MSSKSIPDFARVSLVWDEPEVAIIEVQERYDEPALEPLESEIDLWAEVLRELERRSLRQG